MVAAVALLVLGGSVGWYTARLQAERAQAEREAARATQVAAFLQGIFEGPDPMQLTPDAPRGLAMTAGQLLESGVRRLDGDLADQPAVQASLLSVLGSTYASLGEYPRAVRLLERADGALATLDPPDLPSARVADSAETYREAGDLAGGGRPALGIPAYSRNGGTGRLQHRRGRKRSRHPALVDGPSG
jgi:hypothetical protein